MADELSAEEREFLCMAFEQARDSHEHQVDEAPLLNRFGDGDFLELRDRLERRGGIGRGGAPRGSVTGNFWLTEYGMNEAKRLCSNTD